MEFDNTRRKIGKKLRELRLKAGHSNYEYFAYEHQLSKQTVGRAESGENITLDTMLTLLKIYDVTLEDFFKGIKINN